MPRRDELVRERWFEWVATGWWLGGGIMLFVPVLYSALFLLISLGFLSPRFVMAQLPPVPETMRLLDNLPLESVAPVTPPRTFDKS